MKIERKCIICGKLFESNRLQTITCSEVCSRARCRNRKTEYDRKKKEESKNNVTEIYKTQKLSDDAAKAREIGKSYGKYKAMEYMNMRGGK